MFIAPTLALVTSLVLAQAPPEARPAIALQQPHHDFGKIPPDGKVSHRFKVSNVGSAPLTIKSLIPSCGCTATVMEKNLLLPGEETSIDAAFNPAGMRGAVQKSIQVISNDPTNPTVTLTFRAEVVLEIVPSTTSLYFLNVPRNSPRKTQIQLASGNGEPVVITQIESTGTPYLTGTWKNEGQTAAVEVLFDPAKISAQQRRGNEVLRIGTTHRRVPTVEIYATWELRPVITAEPQRIYFVDSPGKALRDRLILKHLDGKPFTVRSAECRNPQITVEGLGRRAAQQELQVILSASSKKGTLQERLVLLTDDPDQPQLEVIVLAVLK
jgi:hypothetical protein